MFTQRRGFPQHITQIQSSHKQEGMGYDKWLWPSRSTEKIRVSKRTCLDHITMERVLADSWRLQHHMLSIRKEEASIEHHATAEFNDFIRTYSLVEIKLKHRLFT